LGYGGVIACAEWDEIKFPVLDKLLIALKKTTSMFGLIYIFFKLIILSRGFGAFKYKKMEDT